MRSLPPPLRMLTRWINALSILYMKVVVTWIDEREVEMINLIKEEGNRHTTNHFVYLMITYYHNYKPVMQALLNC